MSRYSQRVDALENNESKKRQIFTVIIILLIVLFLGGMVLGAKRILGTEGTHDPYALTATQPLIIDGKSGELLASLSSSLEAASDPDTVKLSVSTDIDIPDDSIAVESGDESFLTQLKYVKSGVLESIKSFYDTYDGHFGDKLTDHAIPISFVPSDTETVTCCRGRADDNGELCDYDTLFYTINFPQVPLDGIESTAIYNNFGMADALRVKDDIIAEISEICTVGSTDIICTDFCINARVDAESGRINEIAYVRYYNVTLLMTFSGDLAPLGTQNISFDFSAAENHRFAWAGLTLSDHTLSIEKGDIHALEATKIADEEVVVTWTSSAPEIAEVDDKGYVRGKSTSTQPVTIIASCTYRGIAYTEICTVFVRVPVTKIETSPKKLELSLNGSDKLTVAISPEKATIKDVLWFTEDDSVATVNEDGTVVAVGIGTTKVYAVSADGYYRSSCVVTVVQ